MTQLQLGWIVGLYEGEGTAGCYTWKRTFGPNNRTCLSVYPTVTIGQNESHMLYLVKKLVGYGALNFDKKRKFWRWRASCNDAVKFLEMIKPYLTSPKRIKQLNKTLEKFNKWKNR